MTVIKPFNLRFAERCRGGCILEVLPFASFSILRAESDNVSIYLIVGVVIFVIGLRLVRYLMMRSADLESPGKQRYGFQGGTLCPKCGKPFGIHWWSFRLIIKRLDRCPHCGKWSLIFRASPEMLAQAEKSMGTPGPETGLPDTPSDSGKKARLLEESKYE